MKFKILVAENLARDFFNLALDLLGSALNVFLIHDVISSSFGYIKPIGETGRCLQRRNLLQSVGPIAWPPLTEEGCTPLGRWQPTQRNISRSSRMVGSILDDKNRGAPFRVLVGAARPEIVRGSVNGGFHCHADAKHGTMPRSRI